MSRPSRSRVARRPRGRSPPGASRLGLRRATAQHLPGRPRHRRRIASGLLAGPAHGVVHAAHALGRPERHVVLVRVVGRQAGAERGRPHRRARSGDAGAAAGARCRPRSTPSGAARELERGARGRGHAPSGWRADPRAGRSDRRPRGTAGPYARCSASYQPAPSPISTRPPLMWSICAATTEKGADWAEGHRSDQGPKRMVLVSRARPASVVHASVAPGSPLAEPILRK